MAIKGTKGQIVSDLESLDSVVGSFRGRGESFNREAIRPICEFESLAMLRARDDVREKYAELEKSLTAYQRAIRRSIDAWSDGGC
jgi:hypothetical protein